MTENLWLDLVELALRHRDPDKAGNLAQCPVVEEMPAQRRIVDEALSLCRTAYGLNIPRGLKIRWRFGRDDAPRGSTRLLADGTVEVDFDCRLAPDQLFRTAIHESAHVSDFASGLYKRFNVIERERRAETFAMRVVSEQGWAAR